MTLVGEKMLGRWFKERVRRARRLTSLIERLPVAGSFVRKVHTRVAARLAAKKPFPGSSAYWEMRYASGGNSGGGSYGSLAQFKAEVLNRFVAEHGVETVVEFGCGDGNQLRLAKYPKYAGYDVSPTALAKCQAIFAGDESKVFRGMSELGDCRQPEADLALSLDVLYHLVEDQVFEMYMKTLFEASRRYVIIYSSDFEGDQTERSRHVRRRRFTPWVERHATRWRLVARIANEHPYRGDDASGSKSDFFVYELAGSVCSVEFVEDRGPVNSSCVSVSS